jgi:hypothetical protein
VLPAEPDRPYFLFFHMASSHIPWDKLPPVVDDWRTLDGTHGQGLTEGRHVRRSKKKEIEFQLSRFKRSNEVRVNRLRPSVQNLGQYAKAIDHELDILTRHVLALPERSSMIILMGDHQPPMMGKSTDFSVPVHVLTRETSLRKEFLVRGFKRGMQVQMSRPNIRHEGLFSVIARAYLPRGAVQGAEKPPSQDELIVTDRVRP